MQVIILDNSDNQLLVIESIFDPTLEYKTYCHSGHNSLAGGNIVYWLYGETSNDSLIGGGADAFVFDSALSVAANVDTIDDFAPAADKIHLDRTIYSKLTTLGTLTAANFRSVADATSTAGDGKDHILYSNTSAALFYDQGSNGYTAMQFAV
jgi:hypothetical protein